jgi:hypothetical protein
MAERLRQGGTAGERSHPSDALVPVREARAHVTLGGWARCPATRADDLVVYGVVGLPRQPMISGLSRYPSKKGLGRRRGSIRMSTELGFFGPGGGRITVTSHRTGDDGEYARTRRLASLDTYLESPQGRRDGAGRTDAASRQSRLVEPPDVEWVTAALVVDDHVENFDACDLGDGFWAAVGRLPGADVTIGSCGIALNTVQLERTARHAGRAVSMPDLADVTGAVVHDLDARFARLPFDRVRRMGDYWALRGIEAEHIHRLARRYTLTTQDETALVGHWLARFDTELGPVRDRLEDREDRSFRSGPLVRRLRGPLFQLWFNTFGPGARTWFGNRFAGVRALTYRLRWRRLWQP